MKSEDIKYIPFDREVSSLNELKPFLDDCIKISDLLNNEIDFIILGHLSLIFRNKKFYRTPADIDIGIADCDFKKLTEILECDFNKTEHGRLFSSNIGAYLSRCKKYSSSNIENCSRQEDEAELYQISQGLFSIKRKSLSKNNLSNKLIIQANDPQWIIHDPLSKLKEISADIKDGYINIRCITNSVGKFFKTFIIFYDSNLKYKSSFELTWAGDRLINTNNKFYGEKAACWSVSILNSKEFDECYYRIVTLKTQMPIAFSSPKITNKIDCSLYQAGFKNIMTFRNNYDIIEYEGRKLKITTQPEALLHKFDRPKDISDIKFFNCLHSSIG